MSSHVGKLIIYGIEVYTHTRCLAENRTDGQAEMLYTYIDIEEGMNNFILHPLPIRLGSSLAV
jgi:hypothetical protein